MCPLTGAIARVEEELPEALRKFLSEGCEEDGEGMTGLLRESIPGLDLDEELQRLLSDSWEPGCLAADCLEAEGSLDVEVGPWLRRPSAGTPVAARRVLARVPTVCLPGAAPRVTFLYRVATWDAEGAGAGMRGRCVTVARAAKAEVPFGECFSVQELTTLVPAEGGVEVSKCFRVVWERSTFLQRLIASNTHGEQRRTAGLLLEVLRSHAAAGTPQPSFAAEAPAAALPTAAPVLEAWEVQRRHGGFGGEGCCLPFLAAAASGGRCWLNADGSSFEVQPPTGWRASAAGWTVVEAPGGCDAEGWQYALRRWGSNRLWGASAAGRRWRRRLWRCALEPAAEAAPGAAPRARAAAARGARKPAAAKPWPLESSLTVFLLVCFLAAALHPAGTGAGYSALSVGLR